MKLLGYDQRHERHDGGQDASLNKVQLWFAGRLARDPDDQQEQHNQDHQATQDVRTNKFPQETIHAHVLLWRGLPVLVSRSRRQALFEKSLETLQGAAGIRWHCAHTEIRAPDLRAKQEAKRASPASFLK